MSWYSRTARQYRSEFHSSQIVFLLLRPSRINRLSFKPQWYSRRRNHQCLLHSAGVVQGNTCTYTSSFHAFLRLLRVSQRLSQLNGGHGLTDSAPCPSPPFTHSNSLVVTGIPIDVNWGVLKRRDVVWLPSGKSDIVGRSYTPARELRDTMSALLYNLDNTITL